MRQEPKREVPLEKTQRNSQFNDRHQPDPVRNGSVLLLVVVVVAMLTLAAYNFAKLMTTEYEASMTYTADVQARASADSGIEFVATLLGNRKTLVAENLIHNPQLFMGQLVSPSPHLRANGRFSIIAPVEHDTKTNAIRYGLMDESAKLNLNYLPNMGLNNDALHAMLMKIPNMSPEIIDAILDWIDTDDTPLPYGAESETYQQMKPAYLAKNGPIESIDELLLIKGITPNLLYGEDANRNGLLDPNENDGEASLPLDNADGILDHGFVAYFSVYGLESNRKSDGTLKINVNTGYLTELYDSLMEAFDEDTAQFIIAYRINGPATAIPESLTNPVRKTPTATSLDSLTSAAGTSTTDEQFKTGLANFLSSVISSGGSVKRGGIDLSKGGPQEITSLWQLIGTTAKVNINGTTRTLTSPWSKETASVTTDFPLIQDKLTITEDDFLQGRININQARREVLMALTGPPSITMTEQIVERIIAAQNLDASGQPRLDNVRQHTTTAWLYAEGLVDLPGMMTLEPWITAHGDVYRAQVLGFFDGGGPVSRVEAMIDSTQRPPRVILQRDLNELGRGYSRAQMRHP